MRSLKVQADEVDGLGMRRSLSYDHNYYTYHDHVHVTSRDQATKDPSTKAKKTKIFPVSSVRLSHRDGVFSE